MKVCWRIEAIDWISMPGIIEINAVEYYSNETEDDIENGIVGGLITEPINLILMLLIIPLLESPLLNLSWSMNILIRAISMENGVLIKIFQFNWYLIKRRLNFVGLILIVDNSIFIMVVYIKRPL